MLCISVLVCYYPCLSITHHFFSALDVYPLNHHFPLLLEMAQILIMELCECSRNPLNLPSQYRVFTSAFLWSSVSSRRVEFGKTDWDTILVDLESLCFLRLCYEIFFPYPPF